MHIVLAYAIAIALAMIAVRITHGSFTRLTELRFERPWLLAIGLGIQIALGVVDIPNARLEDVGVGLLLVSYVAVLGFCASNISTRGMLLIGIGIALNAGVIALNAGMPYTVVHGDRPETTVKHRPERSTDVLPVLSDRLAYGSPLNAAISVGDLLLFGGIIQVAYANSRPTRRRRRAAPTRYVDLPAVEHERVIDVRDAQAEETPAPTDASASTTRSSASSTRGS